MTLVPSFPFSEAQQSPALLAFMDLLPFCQGAVLHMGRTMFGMIQSMGGEGNHGP